MGAYYTAADMGVQGRVTDGLRRGLLLVSVISKCLRDVTLGEGRHRLSLSLYRRIYGTHTNDAAVSGDEKAAS